MKAGIVILSLIFGHYLISGGLKAVKYVTNRLWKKRRIGAEYTSDGKALVEIKDSNEKQIFDEAVADAFQNTGEKIRVTPFFAVNTGKKNKKKKKGSDKEK